jgi:class 3 adenylate cyclase
MLVSQTSQLGGRAMSETRKLAAILVTDIVGFSRLAGADEERTLARIRALRGDLIAPAVAAHHGRIVKGTGDGAIIEFRSVLDATRCAIEMQNGLIERNAGVPPERRIEYRVGIHVGDVVEESDGDLMGDAVNIAARLEGIAKPGTICLSEHAYRQVKGRLEMEVSDLGAPHLKNIADPVRAYLVEVGRPVEPPKPSAAPRHRLVAALAVLAVAGAAGWLSIAGKPSSPAEPSTTPTASLFEPTGAAMPATVNPLMAPWAGAPAWDSFAGKPSTAVNSPTTPTNSLFGPATAIVTPTGDRPVEPSPAEAQRDVKPALTSQPSVDPPVRKVARSSLKRQPSNAEPMQSSSLESAPNSEPCVVSAAQTNGNHSCGYLRDQTPAYLRRTSNAEPARPPPVESALNSLGPCSISAAQTNGTRSCGYLRGD